MEKHGYIIKKFLFAGILLMLLLPFLQHHVRFWESEPLEGFKAPAEKRWFSLQGWWSGEYQEAYNLWHNENFGFRPECVRIYNQIAFDLFNETKANGAIIGKDGYLYELNYINAYVGDDYIGYTPLHEKAIKLKELQDSLAALNKTLIVCFAPGKASFYPEFIPEGHGKATDSTNNKVFSKMLRDYNVNFIDYNQWFMDMKGKTEYLLYPKTGVHWSRYGSTMAIDSLIKYVEKKRNQDLPSMIWTRTIPSDSLQAPDEDIARALNVFWRPKGFTMGYPEYTFESTEGKAYLNMVAFGDSFFFSLLDIKLAPKSFKSILFYYYNQNRYNSDYSPIQPANLEQTIADVKDADVILLMATECTVWDIGWGFINSGHDYFVKHRLVQNEVDLIAKYEARIRADEKWMEDIRKKADAQGKTLDEMIYLDARFLAEQELAESK